MTPNTERALTIVGFVLQNFMYYGSTGRYVIHCLDVYTERSLHVSRMYEIEFWYFKMA